MASLFISELTPARVLRGFSFRCSLDVETMSMHQRRATPLYRLCTLACSAAVRGAPGEDGTPGFLYFARLNS